jgi:hypothetical protein
LIAVAAEPPGVVIEPHPIRQASRISHSRALGDRQALELGRGEDAGVDRPLPIPEVRAVLNASPRRATPPTGTPM